jgi:hypothetical protein
MASSFKTLSANDVVSTRNLLHESIPITGTILSGTYGTWPNGTNIKNYAHGMFQSVYDYPFLSSSANHIFDLTCGYPATSSLSSSTATQNAKKINIYNEMAQVLVGFDQNGNIRRFDQDGDLTQGTKFNDAIFINFTRLLAKDEIKKGSFTLTLGTTSASATPMTNTVLLKDIDAQNSYKVNSPAGEYGILYLTNSVGTTAATSSAQAAGLIYYQAGIVVLSSSVFNGRLSSSVGFTPGSPWSITGSLVSASISGTCDSLRHRIANIQFNNSTELNSTVYFCRANHNEFNYSSNKTYLSASRLVVKNNSQDNPVTYPTAVGLYSPDNELMAVAKLSEPLKKDPTNEFTLRVRLDY